MLVDKARQKLLGSESEKDFALKFEQLLKLKHWAFYHVYEQSSYAHRSTSGFPDYLIFRDKFMLAVELKRESGQLTANQIAWKFVLEEAEVPYYCWRPSDWEEIEKVLE